MSVSSPDALSTRLDLFGDGRRRGNRYAGGIRRTASAVSPSAATDGFLYLGMCPGPSCSYGRRVSFVTTLIAAAAYHHVLRAQCCRPTAVLCTVTVSRATNANDRVLWPGCPFFFFCSAVGKEHRRSRQLGLYTRLIGVLQFFIINPFLCVTRFLLVCNYGISFDEKCSFSRTSRVTSLKPRGYVLCSCTVFVVPVSKIPISKQIFLYLFIFIFSKPFNFKILVVDRILYYN